MGKTYNPRVFFNALRELNLQCQEMALDTETSGLHPDDGARVSTVSVAVAVPDWALDAARERFTEGRVEWGSGVVTLAADPVTEDGPPVWVLSAAWPFDQGTEGTGKPEDTGQGELIPSASNQPHSQWRALLEGVGGWGDMVFHHARFDIAMMMAGCRRWSGDGVDLLPNLFWDTQNVCSMLYAYRATVKGKDGLQVPSTSLKPTSAWLWGESEVEEQKVVKGYLRSARLPAGRWDLIPWDRIGRYADGDARLTLRLYLRQLEDISRATRGGSLYGVPVNPRANLMAQAMRRTEVARMLIRTERRGVPYSLEAAREAERVISREMADIGGRLPFEPSISAAKRYWFGPKVEGGMGLPPYRVTEKGAPSVTERILRQMADDNIHGAGEYARYKGLGLAISRWYRGWTGMVGADGRLHPSFRQNGTVSGRFSVERVQLQAIPHDYQLGIPEGVPTPRGLIEAGVPEGWRLVECDLANAEARVAALLAGCTPMLEAFEQGRDLHGETAKALFNVDEGRPDFSRWRTLAKRANFSFIFGVGADTFRESLDNEGMVISDGEARRIVADWNALYPQYRVAIERHEQRVQRRISQYGVGWVDLLNGERRYFTAEEDTHKAFNQRVQGNLAQLAQDWWLDAHQRVGGLMRQRVVEGVDLETGRWVGGVGGVLMVHDSLDLLVPVGEFGDRCVQAVVDAGADAWGRWFPGVPGRVDPSAW